MIRVQIGGIEKDIGDVTEQWVAQQIKGKEKEGGSVCIRVSIKGDGLDMILVSAGCGSGAGGGGRPPNEREQAIFDLWRDRGLKDEHINPGSLISFLKQLNP